MRKDLEAHASQTLSEAEYLNLLQKRKHFLANHRESFWERIFCFCLHDDVYIAYDGYPNIQRVRSYGTKIEIGHLPSIVQCIKCGRAKIHSPTFGSGAGGPI